MKQILIFLAILFSGVLIFDRAFGFTLEKLYERSFSGVDSKINYLLQIDKKKTLVFGSSRAYQGVNPKIISQDGFNLGAGGKFIGYSAGLIDILDKNNKLADTILVHIDLLSYVNNDKSDYDNKNDIKYLSPYYHHNAYIKKEIKNFQKSECLKYLFASYPHNGKAFTYIKNIIRSNLENAYLNKGFKRNKFSKKIEESLVPRIEKKMREQQIDTFSTISIQAIKYINHIVEICSNNNTQLIFFTTPTLKNHSAPSLIIQSQMEELLKDYPYYNFRKTDLESDLIDNTKYWKDLNHFNGLGADYFSKILNNSIKNHQTSTLQ